MEEKSSVGLPSKKRRREPETGAVRKRSNHNFRLDRKFQGIFDNIPEAIIVTNAQGQIQHLNKEAKSLFGDQVETVQLKNWPNNFGLFLGDGETPYPKHELPLSLALQGKTKQDEELILRKDGEAEGIWISMSSQPLNHEDGELDGTITFIRDITYRKQIELSREKHIRRMESLHQLSRLIAEAGNELKKLSETVAEYTSRVIGDLSIIVLKNGDDLSSKMRVAAFSDVNPTGYTLMRKVLLSGDQFEGERSVVGGVLKSGEPLLIPSIDPKQSQAISLPEFREFVDQVGLESLLIVPLTGRAGTLGVISLSRHRGSKAFNVEDQSFLMDIAYRTALAIENCRLFETLRIEIADRLSTQQQLDITEERFRAIFESTTLGIMVLDLDGNILQTNVAFQSMIGYSEAKLIGKHFSDFLFRADVPRALNLIRNLKVSGATQYHFEHRTVHKNDSTVWVKTTFSPVTNGNENKKLAFIVGIVEDVTEQKHAEQEMKELRDRLQSNIEMERLRLAQELHDNPMQSLYSIIYRVNELRTIVEPDLVGELEKVTSEIGTVIEGLRATATELRPPAISEFGLENAIRSYVDDFLEQHPHLNVTLSLAHDRQLLPEEVRLALFRIFQQALTNVLRHSEATHVNVRFSFDAEELRLEIADNGKGFEVPPDWMEFVRNGHYGLAGAAERISSLGGILKVESEPGNLTTVTVTLPWREIQ